MAQSSTRPKKVQVGHLEFEIQWIGNGDWGDKEKCGLTVPMQQLILLRISDDENDAYSEGNLQEILVHEILHAIYHVTNLAHYTIPKDGKAEIEEYTVAMLAGPLLTVLRGNPAVMRYLTG